MNRIFFLFLIISLTILSCKTVDLFPKHSDNIEERILDINGTQLFVKTCGKGEPMILIHGGPGLDHSYLLPQMYGLSDYYRLIFYDQRACGKSASNSPISLDILVEDIEAIRVRLGLDKIHLLGHSWGGLLAMKYALANPDHMNSMILLNSMAPSDTLRKLELQEVDSLETAFYAEEINSIQATEDFKNNRSSAYEDLFRVIFKKQFYDPNRVDELTLTFPKEFYNNSKKLQALGPDLMDYDLTSDLENLAIPSLIFYGVKESAADLIGPVLWEKLEGSELIILPRCGHFPFIEQPTRLFCRAGTSCHA
jgi:proline iminopeptidase